jgi:hypothetical protein
MAESTTPRITAVKTVAASGPAASTYRRQFPGQARRAAGKSVNDIPWLCVAVIP